MKFHKGSKNEVEDEDLFSQTQSVVAFIVSPGTPQRAVKQPRLVKASKTFFFSTPPPHRPWQMCLAQCATVLLNGPFLLPLKVEAVAKVGLPRAILWDWIAFDLYGEQWLKAFRFLAFFLHSLATTRSSFVHCIFTVACQCFTSGLCAQVFVSVQSHLLRYLFNISTS